MFYMALDVPCPKCKRFEGQPCVNVVHGWWKISDKSHTERKLLALERMGFKIYKVSDGTSSRDSQASVRS